MGQGTWRIPPKEATPPGGYSRPAGSTPPGPRPGARVFGPVSCQGTTDHFARNQETDSRQVDNRKLGTWPGALTRMPHAPGPRRSTLCPPRSAPLGLGGALLSPRARHRLSVRGARLPREPCGPRRLRRRGHRRHDLPGERVEISLGARRGLHPQPEALVPHFRDARRDRPDGDDDRSPVSEHGPADFCADPGLHRRGHVHSLRHRRAARPQYDAGDARPGGRLVPIGQPVRPDGWRRPGAVADLARAGALDGRARPGGARSRLRASPCRPRGTATGARWGLGRRPRSRCLGRAGRGGSGEGRAHRAHPGDPADWHRRRDVPLWRHRAGVRRLGQRRLDAYSASAAASPSSSAASPAAAWPTGCPNRRRTPWLAGSDWWRAWP